MSGFAFFLVVLVSVGKRLSDDSALQVRAPDPAAGGVLNLFELFDEEDAAVESFS
jgi:hypothetical protein